MTDTTMCGICGEKANYDNTGWETGEYTICPRCYSISKNQKVDVENAWSDYDFVTEYYISSLQRSEWASLSDAYAAVLRWGVQNYKEGDWDIDAPNRYTVAKEVVNIGYAIQAVDPHTSYAQRDGAIYYTDDDGKNHLIAEPDSDVYPRALEMFAAELDGEWKVSSIGERGEKQLFTPEAADKIERYKELKNEIERLKEKKTELWNDLQETNESAIAEIYTRIND